MVQLNSENITALLSNSEQMYSYEYYDDILYIQAAKNKGRNSFLFVFLSGIFLLYDSIFLFHMPF